MPKIIAWVGIANQVIFDPIKESFHILHPRYSSNDSFKMLGIKFDTQLKMDQSICEIAAQGHSRITMILRCRRFYPCKILLRLYKQFVLSGIEFATPTTYHANDYALSPLDRLQQRMLDELEYGEKEALLDHALAEIHLPYYRALFPSKLLGSSSKA